MNDYVWYLVGSMLYMCNVIYLDRERIYFYLQYVKYRSYMNMYDISSWRLNLVH